jgi:hypothetical protein
MAVFEHVHAFQVNKTALTNLQANLRLVFEAFGSQLNATSTVDGIYSDWKCHFNKQLHNFDNLTILSFHNSAGNQINNTTLPGANQCFQILYPTSTFPLTPYMLTRVSTRSFPMPSLFHMSHMSTRQIQKKIIFSKLPCRKAIF